MRIGIDYPDHRAIGRGIFALEGKARFLAAAPENQFTDSGSGGIYGHHRFPLRREIFVEGLDNQQLASFQRRILYGRDDGADYAGKLHYFAEPLFPFLLMYFSTTLMNMFRRSSVRAWASVSSKTFSANFETL